MGKRVDRKPLDCPMMYINLGLVIFDNRSMVLLNHSGDIILDITVFKQELDGPIVACAVVPQTCDRCVRSSGTPYINVIEPVVHDDEPTAISAVEAAEVTTF